MTHDEQAPSNDGKQTGLEQDAEILKAYREVAKQSRWVPGEGQEAVEARINLSNAFNRLAELEERTGRNSEGLAARESATSLIHQVRQFTGEHVKLRLMEAAQLNSRGFTLREMENWKDALDIYIELAELMDDGANGTPLALYLMACAQDGIGDAQDTLGDPAARDAAWERARALFQSCIHATKTNPDPDFQMEPPHVLLDDVIAKQQEFI
jgi:tetratricopeptide (TPR) repeat protein